MVAPVTGPFLTVNSHKGPPTSLGYAPTWQYVIRQSYRQRKPYNLPLPRDLYVSMVDTFRCSNPVTYAVSDIGAIASFYTGGVPYAMNKAYAQLVEKLGEQSLWAVNLAEHKQGIDLISKDATVLLKFARALHKFDFVKAARILKMNLPPKGLKPYAKSFGNNFLKFHFGWEPLVKDIGAAVDTLQDPIPPKRVFGKGTCREFGRWSNDINASKVTWTDITRCRTGCTVSVSNPNLHLASQLGFVNPLAIVWELVPFSFVVDWFVNVGQFLSQTTDFAGLSVSESYKTYYHLGKGTATGIPDQPSVAYNVTYTNVWVNRREGLPSVVPLVRPWKGVSPVRAATAISLLVQQLR